MAPRRAVGIDLGTTHSVVASISSAGHSELIRTADGERFTPTAVFLEPQRAVVGREAVRQAPSDHLALCAKRDMGAEFYSRPIGGLRLPPEVIQACVLRQLKADIQRCVGAEFGAVITVPAFFGSARREATADAAEIAGLPLLDILNEPTAAALAFGEHTGYLTAGAGLSGGPLTALVYDLGGHTFEATLLQISPGEITTLGTDGDVHLGGHDWDACIADYVAAQFKEKHREDPHDSPTCMETLLREAERACQTLSVRHSATIMLSHAGSLLEVRITREQFEALAAGLLQRSTEITERLLKTAGVGWPQLSRILLVGGATRMPMVRRRLAELSGRAADYTVSPDEAVARGAALYAARVLAAEGTGKARQFKVTNVNARSLGISGTDTKSGAKKNVILIPRNTPLPAKATKKFVIKGAAQRSIAVTVLEGESSNPAECTPLGRAVIDELPADLKEGWPVEVTYEYQANGRLNVDARVPYTGRSVHLELERASGLSRERVARWKAAVESGGGLNALRTAAQETGGEHKARPIPVATSSHAAARPAAAAEEPAAPATAAPQPAAPERAAAAKPAQPAAAKTLEGYRAVPVARPREPGLVITWRKAAIALVGMLLGYYILCWLAPEINVLHLPIPGGG